jgi:drug/metabolite transporter (DMT)-like permease
VGEAHPPAAVNAAGRGLDHASLDKPVAPRYKDASTPRARGGRDHPMSHVLTCGLLLAVVAVWGWTFTVMKEPVAVYGVASFLAVRFLIGSLAIAPLAARRQTWRSLRTGGLIGVVLAAGYLFQTFGLRQTTATNTGLITGLFIVFAPLANRVLFGVRTSAALWAAVAVSVAGLALLSGGAPAGLAAGDVFALGGAVCFGLQIALLDRYARHHDVLALAQGQLLAATVILLLVWPLTDPIAWPPASVWPALLLTGVVATAVGFAVQTFAQQRLAAVQVAVIIVMEPLFAALFGYLLAGDRLTGVQWLGGGLLVGGLVLGEVYPRLRRTGRDPAARGSG